MLLLLALACSAEFVGATDAATVEDWAGPVGAYLELVPRGMADSPALLIEITQAGWEIRYGDSWSSAPVQDELPVQSSGSGYVVGGSMLVPAPIEVGTTAQGSTITARGELEVWYGTFPDAIEVDIGEGDFAGDAAFAPGVGPLLLGYQGKEWEVAYYE